MEVVLDSSSEQLMIIQINLCCCVYLLMPQQQLGLVFKAINIRSHIQPGPIAVAKHYRKKKKHEGGTFKHDTNTFHIMESSTCHKRELCLHLLCIKSHIVTCMHSTRVYMQSPAYSRGSSVG